MKRKIQDQLSEQNEKAVGEWFVSHGFSSEQPEKTASETGQRGVDWFFEKNGTRILCEVKTIFSGGQSMPSNNIPSVNHKEQDFFDYLDGIAETLERDESIKNLPLDVTLWSKMYIPDTEENNRFLAFIHECIQTAVHGDFVQTEWTYEFNIQETPLVTAKRHLSANLYISPRDLGSLKVGYGVEGGALHERRFHRSLCDASEQLQASLEHYPHSLQTIACWSESRYFPLWRLLLEDQFATTFEHRRARYYALDRIFVVNSEIVAIFLFTRVEAKPPKSILDLSTDPEMVTKALAIYNPRKAPEFKRIQGAIPEELLAIEGMAEEPPTQD